MNPNPDQVAAIRGFVAGMAGDWTNNSDAILAAIRAAPQIANPITRSTVPKPFFAVDLTNACSSGNRANLAAYLIGGAALIIAQDVPHLSEAFDAMAVVGSISSADAAAMKAVMTATEPDPAWTATVPWDVGTIGRPADGFDIETARRGA